jgi:hypothetical protein
MLIALDRFAVGLRIWQHGSMLVERIAQALRLRIGPIP